MWPAGERLLSPFVVCFLLGICGVVPVALLAGSPLRIVGAIALVAGVVTWDLECLPPIARLEQCFAESTFVTRQLNRRDRYRSFMRTREPKIALVHEPLSQSSE